jgi:hypothetical protein
MFQVFHNLVNKTSPEVFQKVKTGDLLKFTFKADPNYWHLSGGTYTVECVGFDDWNFADHTKFGFIVKGNDKKIKHVSVIAGRRTGEVYVCQIYDYGYVHLDIRREDEPRYYHTTQNAEVPITFMLGGDKI